MSKSFQKTKTKAMGKRLRITNERVNSYGFRVLTSGIDISQYNRNPVMLYMHERGQVIGVLKDIEVKDGEMTGEPVFDEASELSTRCKKQYEFGSLKMASIGIDILETSKAKEVLAEGQTRPTVTRCRLFEVSLVDIGSNDDAIVLKHEGETIRLGDGGECPLPLLNTNQQKPREKEMDQKTLALQLGLPETADEAAINAALARLKKAGEDNAELKKEKEHLELEALTAAVETAISEKRIGAERKGQFVELGKKIGLEELKKTFEAMSPQVRLSQMLNHGSGAPQNTGKKTYAKLSEVPGDELLKMRSETPGEYKRLYKAEYGMECEI